MEGVLQERGNAPARLGGQIGILGRGLENVFQMPTVFSLKSGLSMIETLRRKKASSNSGERAGLIG